MICKYNKGEWNCKKKIILETILNKINKNKNNGD